MLNMAKKEFDVFVIGSGKAGRDVAIACAKAGKKVAIADDKEFGGTCANRGCDPKKVIVGLTEILYRSEKMKGHGIENIPNFNWEDLQKFKLRFTDAVPFVNERLLKNEGITLYHQSPKFLDEQTLSVEGKTVIAHKVIIATGQKPMSHYFEGAHLALDSDDFLELKELPKSMIFIGGGYIGMELAHIAARLGVEVTVIHSQDRPLNNFDKDMVDQLIQVSEAIGIQFIFNARAHKIEALQKNYRVTASQKEKDITVKAEMVFLTTGRVPSIDSLDLEIGKVAFTSKGVTVNKKLQNPSNPNVYACGDVADSEGLPLTPLSSYEAAIVISQLLDTKNQKETSYPPQATAVYTLPNLASIGMSEKEAQKEVGEVIVKFKSIASSYSPKHINDDTYAYKTIVEKATGKILGAHLIGFQVAETINIFALAIANDLTVDDIKKTIFTYPSWGNDVKSMV